MPGPFERRQYIIGREIFIGHWLAVLPIKTSAAIRRIPLVAFGPHLNEEALDRVRSAGRDKDAAWDATVDRAIAGGLPWGRRPGAQGTTSESC